MILLTNSFKDYVDEIDNCEAKFEKDGTFHFNQSLKPKEIKKSKNKQKKHLNYFYPSDKYTDLPEECQQRVINAVKDPQKQYELGISLIEGNDGFPVDRDIGMNYLKSSIHKNCDDAILYYSKLLLEQQSEKNIRQAKYPEN